MLSPAESQGQRICPRCQRDNLPIANFCESCGERMPEQERPARPVNAGPASIAPADVAWGILAILCAVGGQWLLRRAQTAPAIGLYAVGILLALWAFRRNKDFALPASAQIGPLNRLNPLWLLPIALLPGAAAAWSLERLLVDPAQPPPFFWTLHIASLLLFIGCVYIAERRAVRPISDSPSEGAADSPPSSANISGRGSPRQRISSEDAADPRPSSGSKLKSFCASALPWTTGERLAVIAIICVGLFTRLHELPAFPASLWYDEAAAALEAQRILNDPSFRPRFIMSMPGRDPSHYVYLISFLFRILPQITFVMRLAPVIAGALSVPAAYLAGSQLFGRGPALALAFLVAVSRWSVNFSRITMANIFMTLFLLLSVGLLLKALRRGRLTDFLWAGLALGFGLNTYSPFPLFLPIVSVFLLYHLFTHRALFRAQWKGFVVLAVGVALFLAPVAAVTLDRPDLFLSRTRMTSIFNEYPADQVWEKIWDNAVIHLRMYHERGDGNGRHNLPGEPMLAPVAGALLVLGLALSLSRFWRARFLFLIFWFFGMMAAGVLTISWEAPQAARTIGTMPAAYLLGVVPLAMLWQNWRAASRRGADAKGYRIFLWRGNLILFVSILLAAVAIYNYNTYFVRQKNDFAVWNAYSTGQSIAAQIISEQTDRGDTDGNDTDVYLTSPYSYHPSVQFIVGSASPPPYRNVTYMDTLPMPFSPDRDALFLLDPHRQNLVAQARAFYPNAEFIEHQPPFGGPTVLYEFRLKPSDIAAIQGLQLSYYRGDAWSGAPLTLNDLSAVSMQWPEDAPVDGSFSAEWIGVLNVDTYGPHRLILRAPAAAELYVDEERVAQIDEGDEGRESSVTLNLALGLHNLRLRAVGAAGAVTLSWQRPGEEEQVVPASALYAAPVASNGLLGRYYANGDWQDPPAFSRIDPQVALFFHYDMPLPSPYTIEWIGTLAVPSPGVYELGIESVTEAELWIDGQSVAVTPQPNWYIGHPIELTEGMHDIRIRYAARAFWPYVNLYWTPPGQPRQLIPAAALFPPRGRAAAHMARENLSIFDDPASDAAADPLGAAAPLPAEAAPAAFAVVSDDLERPQGVTAANGRLYVADLAQRALLVLDTDGREIAKTRRSNRRFIEPVDVAADADGNIYLLDAGGQVSVHDADGAFLRAIPIADHFVARSRGLDVDNDGRVWLAMTSAQAVAAFNADGEELIRFSTVVGERALQPIDVAFHADDAVYVSTVDSTSVVRFSRNGDPLRVWPLPSANSVDGPHLSLDSQGVLYATQPQQGGFLRISPADPEEIEAWVLPANEPPRILVGVSVGPDGNLFLTDSEQGIVYRAPISPPP